jgi:hypothetical protein
MVIGLNRWPVANASIQEFQPDRMAGAGLF